LFLEIIARYCNAKYITGLSATVIRKDGHQPIIYMQCGKVCFNTNSKTQANIRPFDHKINMSAIVSIIINLINWFAWFLAVLAVVLGMYAGFLYITAGGDAEKTRKGTKTFIFTIIGLIIAMFSFGMVSFLEAFL